MSAKINLLDNLAEHLLFHENKRFNPGGPLENKPITENLIAELEKEDFLGHKLKECILEPFFHCKGPPVKSHIVSKSQLTKLNGKMGSNSEVDTSKPLKSLCFHIAAKAPDSDVMFATKKDWGPAGPVLKLFCSQCEKLFTGENCSEELSLYGCDELLKVSIDNPNLGHLMKDCPNLSFDFSQKFKQENPPDPKASRKENLKANLEFTENKTLLSLYAFYIKYLIRLTAYYARIAFSKGILWTRLASLPLDTQKGLLGECGMRFAHSSLDELDSLESKIDLSAFRKMAYQSNTMYIKLMGNLSILIHRLQYWRDLACLYQFYCVPLPVEDNKMPVPISKWVSEKRISKENFENKAVFSGILSASHLSSLDRPCLIGWLEKDPDNEQGGLIQYAGIFGLISGQDLASKKILMTKKYRLKELQKNYFKKISQDVVFNVIDLTKGGSRFYPLFGNSFCIEEILKKYDEIFGDPPYLFNTDSFLMAEDQLERRILGGIPAKIKPDLMTSIKDLEKFKNELFSILRR